MIRRRRCCSALALALMSTLVATAAGTLQTPEQFLGFKVGADNKLVRWDKIVDYMKLAAANSDRVRFRELGKTSDNNPFIALEISSPDTLKNLDRYKQLERKLYFQGGAPTDTERDEIFRQGKLVLLDHLQHPRDRDRRVADVGGAGAPPRDRATRPTVKKILDNVIFVLVPSLNPDGQIMVTDWFNKNVGTEYANSPIPYLYHPYVGHDNNRDMYMFTQKESQHTAQLLWHDWFPSVWLDEHQMGSNGAAHLRDAGDRSDQRQRAPADLPVERHPRPVAGGGARGGRQGRDHLQLHLHELLGRRDGVERLVAQPDRPAHRGRERARRGADRSAARRARPAGAGRPAAAGGGRGEMRFDSGPLPAPTDINSRTEYPRPWMGGHWTLRDIVDYELIATMALLETAADRRETIMRQIYEVNRQTIEDGKKSNPSAILVPVEHQQDAREAAHLVDKLQHGRRRDLPRRRGVRGRRQEVRRRHVRDPDDAGLRALRQGHAREADVSGGPPLADVARRSRPTTSPPGRSACCSASTRCS